MPWYDVFGSAILPRPVRVTVTATADRERRQDMQYAAWLAALGIEDAPTNVGLEGRLHAIIRGKKP